MGYKVKWVEDNLGITRKAIRVFESAGLMPKNGACKYESSKYRDYTEEDIDRLWEIRVMQGMGYTLKEIAQMISDENFDFDNSIAEKITELEKEKKKLEQHLGYAKTIKMTGRFPSRPSKMGEIKFEDFQEKVLQEWNITDDPQSVEYQKIAETFLSKTPEEFENTDLGRMIAFFQEIATMDTDKLLIEYVLPKAIIKRKTLGPNHSDIQLLLKLIYENQSSFIDGQPMTKKQFSRFYSSSFLCGDIAKMKSTDFTEDECLFIAEATAVFGGYDSYNTLLEEEAKYGR